MGDSRLVIIRPENGFSDRRRRGDRNKFLADFTAKIPFQIVIKDLVAAFLVGDKNMAGGNSP